MKLPTIEYRDALFSLCGKYRYSLERRWSGATAGCPLVVWCMLNPSTADAYTDDATIRRCVGFTDSLGFGRLAVINLYAYRATNPRDLEGLTAPELQGPDNIKHMLYWLRGTTSRILICGWGANRFKCLPLPGPIAFAERYAYGLTKSGEPKHPLYLPADSKLIRVST